MINKIFKTAREAIADIPDGATIMIGGFTLGGSGNPWNLIDALIEQGARNLTVICNNYRQLNELAREKHLKKAITGYEAQPGYNPRWAFFEDAHRRGEVELEGVSEGILPERIRAGAAGIAGFYTRVGADTLLAKGKERKTFDGKECILERALTADYALIKAYKGDTLGNLVYYKAARNINPTMAQAAKITIVEVEEIVEAGELDPEVIVTPGLFVDRIVKVKKQLRDLFVDKSGVPISARDLERQGAARGSSAKEKGGNLR